MPQSSNQKRLKWSNTTYVNKWSFIFKIKLCVFLVTMTSFCVKVIRTFNAPPVKTPHFKSLLTREKRTVTPFFYCIFLMFISWMFITQSFEKSLIVEQFQGNYLKWNRKMKGGIDPSFSLRSLQRGTEIFFGKCPLPPEKNEWFPSNFR